MYSYYSTIFTFVATLLSVSPVLLADIHLCKNSQSKYLLKDTACNQGEKLLKKINIPDLVNRYSKKTYSYTDQNLVKNPSFNNKLSGWIAQFQINWEDKIDLNDTGGISIQAKMPPMMDTYIHETTLKQCVAFDAGGRYMLAVSVRLDTIQPRKSANKANLYWYESTDCSNEGRFGNDLEPENKFDRRTLKADNLTSALHAKAAQIILAQNRRYSGNSRVRWDDVLLVATEFKPKSITTNREQYTRKTGINYLINGAFNAKLSGWKISGKTEWSRLIGNTEPGAAKVSRYSNSGSNGSNAFYQCVNIGGNTQFELGASFKRDTLSTAAGNGRLRLTWYQDLNCKGPSKTDSNWKDPEPIDGWQKLHIPKLIMPPDSQSAVIEVIQSINEPGHYFAYWDDIYFRATQ